MCIANDYREYNRGRKAGRVEYVSINLIISNIIRSIANVSLEVVKLDNRGERSDRNEFVLLLPEGHVNRNRRLIVTDVCDILRKRLYRTKRDYIRTIVDR